VIVLSFKFDQNWLSGYRDFSGQNLGCCITLANGLYSPVLPYRRDYSDTVITRTMQKKRRNLYSVRAVARDDWYNELSWLSGRHTNCMHNSPITIRIPHEQSSTEPLTALVE